MFITSSEAQELFPEAVQKLQVDASVDSLIVPIVSTSR